MPVGAPARCHRALHAVHRVRVAAAAHSGQRSWPSLAAVCRPHGLCHRAVRLFLSRPTGQAVLAAWSSRCGQFWSSVRIQMKSFFIFHIHFKSVQTFEIHI
jgi:hypothetical protein